MNLVDNNKVKRPKLGDLVIDRLNAADDDRL